MTDKNTLDRKSSILMHSIGVLVIFAVSPAFLQLKIDFLKGLFIILGTVCGCWMTFSKRRNRWSVFIDLLIPVELIALYSRDTRSDRLTWVLLAVWGLLAVGYAVLVIHSGHARRGYFRFSVGQFRWIMGGIRTMFAVIMIVFMITLCKFDLSASISEQVPPSSLESCEASLERLEESNFISLSREDKLDVLHDVCRVEFSELHTTHGFALECSELDDKDLAQYDESNYTITINSKYIDGQSSFSLVRSMCHECYHARQYDLLRGYDSLGQYTEEQLKEIQQVYRRELNDYCTPHEDRERYHSQRLEKDANSYADFACLRYLRFYELSESQYRDIRAVLMTNKGE